MAIVTYKNNGNIVELSKIIHEEKQSLNVKYNNKWYRVIYKAGIGVNIIEPRFLTVDYVPGSRPDGYIIDGICHLVDEFYKLNLIEYQENSVETV